MQTKDSKGMLSSKIKKLKLQAEKVSRNLSEKLDELEGECLQALSSGSKNTQSMVALTLNGATEFIKSLDTQVEDFCQLSEEDESEIRTESEMKASLSGLTERVKVLETSALAVQTGGDDKKFAHQLKNLQDILRELKRRADNNDKSMENTVKATRSQVLDLKYLYDTLRPTRKNDVPNYGQDSNGPQKKRTCSEQDTPEDDPSQHKKSKVGEYDVDIGPTRKNDVPNCGQDSNGPQEKQTCSEQDTPENNPSQHKKSKVGEYDVDIDPSLHFLVGKSTSFTLSSTRTDFHYRGEHLQMDSINTLNGCNWLDDRVINAFLGIVVDENNRYQDNNHIFLIPSYIPVQWAQGDFQSHLFEKVKLSAFRWIVVPVNVSRDHWILMAVDVPNQTVSVLDSLPGRNLDCFQHWRTFFTTRSMALGTPDVEWRVGGLQSTRQENSYNCGVFVLMNAMAIAKGVDLDLLRSQHADKFRKFVICQLHLHAHTREEQLTKCEVPGCHGDGRTQRCCVVCGRWAHKECSNMGRGRSYVCIICEAVYGV